MPKGIKKRVKILRLSEDIVAAEIPIWEEKFGTMNISKLKKQVKKAKRALEDCAVTEILLTNSLREALNEPKFDLKSCFFELAHKIVLWAAKKYKIKYPFNLALRQENPNFAGFYTVQKLIYDCGDFALLTDKIQKGSRFCEKILEEYGAAAEILPYNTVFYRGITVDLDKSEVCLLGKYVLNDFEAEEDTFGYEVDSLELSAKLNENFGNADIKSCMCGKNKLTLK